MIFDLDDTLVDQRSAAHAAVIPWAVEQGVVGDAGGLAARWDAVADHHYPRYQLRQISFQGQRRARVREFLGRDLSDAEADVAFEGYLARYEAGWATFPEVGETLARVRACGLRVGILTNGDATQQRRKLDRVGLSPSVEAMVASSELPVGKPDARAFHAAAHRLDVVQGEALMVGDSVDTDVRGALAAGMHAVLVDRSGQHAGVDVPRIRSLADLDLAACEQ